jgi:hypothetical protein
MARTHKIYAFLGLVCWGNDRKCCQRLPAADIEISRRALTDYEIRSRLLNERKALPFRYLLGGSVAALIQLLSRLATDWSAPFPWTSMAARHHRTRTPLFGRLVCSSPRRQTVALAVTSPARTIQASPGGALSEDKRTGNSDPRS